jgi:hypothetical protein
MLYQYGGNSQSRLNPRLPGAQKTGKSVELEEYNDLFDDKSQQRNLAILEDSVLSPLIGESLLSTRTPMDLIQVRLAHLVYFAC